MVCRRIDIAEFNRDYLSTCRHLFNDGGFLSIEQCKRPFVNPNWRIAGIPESPDGPWSPKTCPECAQLAQPGQASSLDPLIWTWKKLGITRVVATNRDWMTPEMPTDPEGRRFRDFHAVCSARLEDLIGLWKEDWPHLAFDASGTWGLHCVFGEDISLLIGDDRFMDTFYEASGGEVAVRKRFDHFMLEHGYLFVCHPDHPDKYAYDFLYDDLLKWPQPDWINGTPLEY
ncbi:hypothetical protein [Roseospirillum parvum]|uniref:Uncharacterized protein n=1 Tax=Roseospirillum parvum TaxID=83401 RepID=A0A1G7V6A1_9PROT|nr:hypothetical protein [Roseospirillum parvum]SDG55247.1 hypothetical protein SAMN05421742_101554 [Roseospirillum parvum]